MMRLESLQREYIQKSRIFLYPMLGIKRGVSVTPIQTYMSWTDKYSVKDCRLIAVYYLREDPDFKAFEQNRLLNNKFYDNFFQLEDGTGAYVFNFSEFAEDYAHIAKGKYSKLNTDWKYKILDFFQTHKTHHLFIASYLTPENYFPEYARLLDVERALLRSVGELCSPPNLILENLQANEKIINFGSVKTNKQEP